VKHLKTNKFFCLKEVLFKLVELSAKQILVEAKSMKSIDHPNVVKLHEAFFDEKGFSFVMEYMDKGDLFNILKNRESPFSESEAISLLSQLVEGLNAIHSKGWIHRDFKPHNILLNSEGKCKIADFGLAKSTKSVTSSSIAGTLEYMCPELFQGQAPSPATDIWSLGCILYEVLTKRKAFDGNNSASIVNSVLNKDPPLIHSHLSNEIQTLIQQMMSKDPKNRIDLKTIRNILSSMKSKNVIIFAFKKQ
jgi:serine/threonine protein kinase